MSLSKRTQAQIERRLITSLTNDTVKNVRALHMRKEREATGRFLAEGLKFIGEALDQDRAPRLLLVGEDARPHPILRGGGPADYVEISEDQLFRMRRPD